jgi:hypothetical protein
MDILGAIVGIATKAGEAMFKWRKEKAEEKATEKAAKQLALELERQKIEAERKRIRKEVRDIRERAVTATDRQGTRTVSYDEYFRSIDGDHGLIKEIVDEEAKAYRANNPVQSRFRR